MSNENAKKLGFFSIILLTINSIIGSGIFLSPSAVVLSSGKYAPIVYFAAAIFAAILAISFASAAKYVNKAGAAYAYAKAAFGANVGFYVGITRFFAAAIAWGVMATAVVKTVLTLFVEKNYLNEHNFFLTTIGFLILIFILFLINIAGNKVFKFINSLSAIGKILALVVTIAAGFMAIMLGAPNQFNDIEFIVNPKTNELLKIDMNVELFVSAMIAAFYAFTGFESVASGANDMQKPEKNLPKAIPLAILIIAFIYIGIILVCLMLNPKDLIQSNETVVLVSVFKNEIIKQIIFWGSLISMFGINVAASFHTPRILEAIANEKQIPRFIAKRTSNNFPLSAFIITIFLAILIPISFAYNIISILIISSISRFIQFLLVPLSVIVFYYGKNKEDIIKTTKKNFFTDVIISILSIALSVFLLIKFNWIKQFSINNSINYYAILSMLFGYVFMPLLLFFVKNKKE